MSASLQAPGQRRDIGGRHEFAQADRAVAVGHLHNVGRGFGCRRGLRDQAAGLFTEQISMPADSPYVGRPHGDRV